jgi:hypothetical protein
VPPPGILRCNSAAASAADESAAHIPSANTGVSTAGGAIASAVTLDFRDELFASGDGFVMHCLRSGLKFGHASVAARLYGALVVLAAASVVALVIAA